MELLADLLMPSLWAFLACVGFGLVYNIQGAGILICGFGGALGWFFYLIARQWVGSIVAAFLAAVAITVFSEWMARVRRCPVTGYLQVALLPLVPGSGIYYSMRYCVAGDTQQFLSTLLTEARERTHMEKRFASQPLYYHTEIFHAIEEKDSQRAADLMRDHLRMEMEYLDREDARTSLLDAASN